MVNHWIWLVVTYLSTSDACDYTRLIHFVKCPMATGILQKHNLNYILLSHVGD